MISEAIEKVLSLAPPRRTEIHSLEYQLSNGAYALVAPPEAAHVGVTTLAGLVELLESGLNNFDKKAVMVHVRNWHTVVVAPIAASAYGRRPAMIEAEPVKGASDFAFNQFLSQENFIIGLQSCFEKTPDLAELLDIAAHIDMTEKVTIVDSGVLQNVTMRKGQAFKEERTIKPRVTLAPYRTFREVAQPPSDFIFRVQDGGKCGLFEADGGSWKIAAIGLVAAWLKNRLHTSLVDGLGDIPIIS